MCVLATIKSSRRVIVTCSCNSFVYTQHSIFRTKQCHNVFVNQFFRFLILANKFTSWNDAPITGDIHVAHQLVVAQLQLVECSLMWVNLYKLLTKAILILAAFLYSHAALFSCIAFTVHKYWQVNQASYPNHYRMYFFMLLVYNSILL